MERKEDIGKLLKKQLEGAKRAPSGELWSKIDDSLTQRDKRRKRLFFYWFTGSGLTILLFLVLLTTSSDFNENGSEHSPVDLTEFSSTESNPEDSDPNSEETENVIELSSEDNPDGSIVNAEELINGEVITSENEFTLTEAIKETTLETNSEAELKNRPPATTSSDDISTKTFTPTSGTTQNQESKAITSTVESKTKTTDPSLKLETLNSEVNKTMNEGAKVTGIISTSTVDSDPNFKVEATNDLKRKGTLDSLKINSEKPTGENTGNPKEILSPRDSLVNKRLAVRDSLRKDRIALKDSLRNQRNQLRDSLLKERLEVKDSLLKVRLAVKDSLTKTKVEQDSSMVEEVKKPEYLWDFSIIGAPSYFGISNNGSAIDGQFEGADKTGSFGISYGATVNLAILERFTLSFGALKTKFSNSTNDIAAVSTEERNRILSFTDTEFETFSGFLGEDETVTILQDIEYVEMPFHLKYRLGRNTLGFHIYGGFSTYILTNDEVFARNSAGDNLSLGRASRLSPINISLDGGFGFYYNFSETLGLEINPTYKYHLNTITAKTFNGRTYSMGVYSGLRYKF